MSKLINGKQLATGTLKENLLLVTGTTASNGQILAYDGGSGGFSWVNNTGGVASVSGATALDQTSTTGNVVLDVRTDSSSIYVDGTNNLTLGDPDNGNLISGGNYIFNNDLTVNGDFTVLGTATTINTETLSVEDNLITLNSTFTAGTPTLNGGIEILRGSGNTVEFRWNESFDWWEISNPEGTGTTYNPVLTTASIESSDSSITVTTGAGIDADKLDIVVDESNFSNIPNSALTNSDVTVTAGDGLGGGGTVALGGTVVLSANTDGTTIQTNADQLEVLKVPNALTFGSGISGTSATFDGSGAVTIQVDTSDIGDSFSTGGTVAYVAEAGTISVVGNDGFNSYNITGVTDTFSTGATLNGTNLSFDRNDTLSAFTVDLSSVQGAFTHTATGSITPTNVYQNSNTANYSSNLGGRYTQIHSGATYSTVAGGYGSSIYGTSTHSFIGSTLWSIIKSDSKHSAIVSGKYHNIGGATTSGQYSSIGAGEYNVIGDKFNTTHSFIGGGHTNDINADFGFIGGGKKNTLNATSIYGVIGGGYSNAITSNANSSIVGGSGNTVNHDNSHIIGSNITSFTADTTHVEKLNIGTLNGTTAVTALAIDANGMVVDGASLGVSDTFSSAGTISYVAEAGTISIVGNAGFNSYTITGVTDLNVTGGTYNNGSGDITFTNNDATTFAVDLSSLDLNDTFTTGATVVGTGIFFDNQDSLSAYTVDLSSFLDDTNTFTTGSTLIGDTAYFDTNVSLSAFTLDLSTLDVGDSFSTGATVTSGALQITGNAGFGTINASGTILQSLTAENGLTASTTNGAVTVGIDFGTGATQVNAADIPFTSVPSCITGTTIEDAFNELCTLQGLQSVPTKLDKGQTPLANTNVTGGTISGVSITAASAEGSQINLGVNGVIYVIGETTGDDIYFTTDGGATAVAFASLTGAEEIFWDGPTIGFDIETTDNLDLHYNILA